MNKVRYLGVHSISAKALSCDYDLIEKSLYRAFNTIYGKVGRLASVNVVLNCLTQSACQYMAYCYMV